MATSQLARPAVLSSKMHNDDVTLHGDRQRIRPSKPQEIAQEFSSPFGACSACRALLKAQPFGAKEKLGADVLF